MKQSLYYNNSTFDLEIKVSRIVNAGNGVFTKVFIPKFTIIGKYEGQIKLNGGKKYNSDYTLIVSKKLSIDASKFPRVYMAMLNDAHSSDFHNNCVFKKIGNSIYIMSSENIEVQSELFVSYGLDYWKSR